MCQQSFILPGSSAEHAAHPLNISEGASQEIPHLGNGLPYLPVARQNGGLIVDRIEGDSQQDQIPALLESLLETSEIVGEAEAIIRERTSCIDEIERDYLAPELRKTDRTAGLIDERKIGHRLARCQLGRRALLHQGAEQLKAARLSGIPLRAFKRHRVDVLEP